MPDRILTVLFFALAAATAWADEAADRQAVMQTDREFAAYAQEHGPPAAFSKYMADDATWLPINGHPVQGRDAIVTEMSKGPEYELNWHPVASDVSGDMAYTWGEYTVRFQDPEQGEVTGYGKYTAVWRRQSDGSWRWVLDMGNPSPPPGPPPGPPPNGERQRPDEH
jgi:ketosteroid isomerase-like protein